VYAVKAVYDGVNIKPTRPISVEGKHDVIITFINPVSAENAAGGEFSEFILADLISQGYEGSVLLAKFKEKLRLVRPAVQRLIEEADVFAKSGEGRVSFDDLFGEVE
jgi:hypothetical protein